MQNKKNFLALDADYGIIPLVIELTRNNIEKIAQTPEDKVLLAKVWDKLQAGMGKNIPAHSPFLSPRELELTWYLFGNAEGLHRFGGYPDAQRQMLIYLPDYLDASALTEESSPIVCLRAGFYEGDTPTHRDFLGALIGEGIAREAVGDICVGKGSCDFFVSSQIAAYLLQNFTQAGRTKLKLQSVPLSQVEIAPPETVQLKDTLSSLRLDSLVSAGFRIGRSQAAQYVLSGKASIDGLPCDKPDKAIAEGATVAVRGLGKIKLTAVGGHTKKGRISVNIDRYV